MDVFVPKFQWHDYILFIIMLLSSTLIGIYFGYKGNKKGTVNDYIFGGKSMSALPIAFSTTSTIISAVSFMTMPAEVYKYGAGISALIFTMPILALIGYFAVFPIYLKMKVTTIFEYIELRFNSTLKKVTASCYLLKVIFLCPMYLYLPSLLLAQGSNIDINLITLVVTIVCIFYTTLGGIKAVVWTDTLQFVFMLVTCIAVCIIGSSTIGTFSEIFLTAVEGKRLDINFNLDLTKRETFWAVVFGYTTIWFQILMVNQASVQKFMSLPNRMELKKCLIIFSICMSGTFFIVVYLGLIMYAEFKDCDPLLSKKISKLDQMIPYYILHVTSNVPGLAGLFIAGIFSASLSSLSAGLNAVSCTIYNDFVKKFLPQNTSEIRRRLILNFIVAGIGFFCLGLSFIVPYLGPLFVAFFSMSSIVGGPLLGLFLLGMFVPKAHSKGATIGFLVSLLFMSWMVLGTQYFKIKNLLVLESKTVSTDGCPAYLNLTNSQYQRSQINSGWKPMFIYRISFFYYYSIGVLIVILVGTLVSRIVKSEDNDVKKGLISPVMRWTLRPSMEYSEVAIDEINVRI